MGDKTELDEVQVINNLENSSFKLGDETLDTSVVDEKNKFQEKEVETVDDIVTPKRGRPLRRRNIKTSPNAEEKPTKSTKNVTADPKRSPVPQKRTGRSRAGQRSDTSAEKDESEEKNVTK